jgi:hypothetical protein
MYPRNPWIGRLIHNNLPKTLKKIIGLGLAVRVRVVRVSPGVRGAAGAPYLGISIS